MTALDPELERLVAEHDAARDPTGAGAAARRAAVGALHAAGRVAAPAAKVAAARVLVHGEVRAEVELAQALALAALPQQRAARRLAATAYDRLRLLAGRPQKFGTQFVVRDGVLELWPVDPLTTDSERAKWDVEPLAELRRRAAAGPPPR
ncbi:MAG: hypothetical protein JNM25_06845 [Planctomycetes bacterium]|nr:hypothetical protein [Planctomycetota bacterium]